MTYPITAKHFGVYCNTLRRLKGLSGMSAWTMAAVHYRLNTDAVQAFGFNYDARRAYFVLNTRASRPFTELDAYYCALDTFMKTIELRPV